MLYRKYTYLYPPRPHGSSSQILPAQIEDYEKMGWYASVKKHGTNNEMAISPSPAQEIIAKTRHKTDHMLWSPNVDTRKFLRFLKGKGWYYFVCELLQSKIANGKSKGLVNINYINDILVADGTMLVGTTFGERVRILDDLFPDRVEDISGSHYVIDSNTWLAKNYTSGFKKLFFGLTRPDDEGLVIKNPKAPLAFCTRETSNVNWLVKVKRDGF